VSDFPALKLRDLGGGLVVEEDSSGTDDSKQNCDLFSVHLIDYKLSMFILALIYQSRIYDFID